MQTWKPSDEQIDRAAMTRFLRAHGFAPQDYAAAHSWSVSHLEEFWRAIWTTFGVANEPGPVLGDRAMPGTEWFPEARVNWARQVFSGKPDGQVAVVHSSELRPLESWTWDRLHREAARIRRGLVENGVEEGDRVAAYLPNLAETVAALLATASLGAIWVSAAPEFGAQSVIDRFSQVAPKVLLVVDGYRYGGRNHDRSEQVAQIHEQVGGNLVRFGYLDGAGWPSEFGVGDAAMEFVEVPFGHPLWILFSSGTTGLPKAIVHSQGGILLEQLKTSHLHLDARAEDRVFWFTTTGWMMWNFLVGVLTTDAPIVLYDGSPAGDALWSVASDARATVFGGGAAYFAAQMKDGACPAQKFDLSSIRAVGSTGSPLSPEAFDWIYETLGPDLWLFSTSGGTDVCTAFVGGVPTLPVHRGELQARALGVALEAWDDQGKAVVDEVGELVVTQPMPSMPIGFWGDVDGSQYRDAYFDTYPGVWRHGDWITINDHGGAVIHGRSDATINRGGVRMGSSELYRAVLTLDEVVDALVVDPNDVMHLFVVLRPGLELSPDLERRIASCIRTTCSPRHVPDHIHQIAEVPRTLSGKALEIPVKRLLMGVPVDVAVSKDSLANPAALDAVVQAATAVRTQ